VADREQPARRFPPKSFVRSGDQGDSPLFDGAGRDLVGLPAIAAAGGWLFAGREPSGITTSPLE
jgi:hypothetical protein